MHRPGSSGHRDNGGGEHPVSPNFTLRQYNSYLIVDSAFRHTVPLLWCGRARGLSVASTARTRNGSHSPRLSGQLACSFRGASYRAIHDTRRRTFMYTPFSAQTPPLVSRVTRPSLGHKCAPWTTSRYALSNPFIPHTPSYSLVLTIKPDLSKYANL